MHTPQPNPHQPPPSPFTDLQQLLDQLQNSIASLQTRVSELEAALPQKEPETLLSVANAATMLGMTSGSLRQACYRGTIPSIKVGRRVRLRRSDVQALLAG